MSFGAFLNDRRAGARRADLGGVPMGEAGGRAYARELSALRNRWENLAAWAGGYRDVGEQLDEIETHAEKTPEEGAFVAHWRSKFQPKPPPTRHRAEELERVLKPFVEHWRADGEEPPIEAIQGLHAEVQQAEGFASDYGYGAPPRDAPPTLEEMSAGVAAAEEIDAAARAAERKLRKAAPAGVIAGVVAAVVAVVVGVVVLRR